MFKEFLYVLLSESKRLKEAGVMPPDTEETTYSRIFVVAVFSLLEIAVLYVGFAYEMSIPMIGLLTLCALVATFIAGSICFRVYRYFSAIIIEGMFGGD